MRQTCRGYHRRSSGNLEALIEQGERMRSLNCMEIANAIERMCIDANRQLPADLKQKIEEGVQSEVSPLGRQVLSDLVDNYQKAQQLMLPICQDTGLAVVFAEVGQEVALTGMPFEEAINLGVARGYQNGLLRCSVVGDPLMNRKNTDDNTPAIIHTRIVPGDKVQLTVAPKGAGSENMSFLKMFSPSATRENIIDYVVGCVEQAGSNPCPPIVLGVGIGGNFERVALLAKQAVCRPVIQRNALEYYADMEEELLMRVNETGIGPQGFGGSQTALAVNIEVAPTHIASLPVAVNIGCHVTRHVTIIL